MKKALVRKPGRTDLMGVEVGAGGEVRGRIWVAGIGIYIDTLALIVAGACPEQYILGRAYLLAGNCFLRLREALRGSKLSDRAPAGPLEPRPEDCSSSSTGRCIESDLVSIITFRRACKQRVHIAGLDIRRRARVN